MEVKNYRLVTKLLREIVPYAQSSELQRLYDDALVLHTYGMCVEGTRQFVVRHNGLLPRNWSPTSDNSITNVKFPTENSERPWSARVPRGLASIGGQYDDTWTPLLCESTDCGGAPRGASSICGRWLGAPCCDAVVRYGRYTRKEVGSDNGRGNASSRMRPTGMLTKAIYGSFTVRGGGLVREWPPLTRRNAVGTAMPSNLTALDSSFSMGTVSTYLCPLSESVNAADRSDKDSFWVRREAAEASSHVLHKVVTSFSVGSEFSLLLPPPGPLLLAGGEDPSYRGNANYGDQGMLDEQQQQHQGFKHRRHVVLLSSGAVGGVNEVWGRRGISARSSPTVAMPLGVNSSMVNNGSRPPRRVELYHQRVLRRGVVWQPRGRIPSIVLAEKPNHSAHKNIQIVVSRSRPRGDNAKGVDGPSVGRLLASHTRLVHHHHHCREEGGGGGGGGGNDNGPVPAESPTGEETEATAAGSVRNVIAKNRTTQQHSRLRWRRFPVSPRSGAPKQIVVAPAPPALEGSADTAVTNLAS